MKTDSLFYRVFQTLPGLFFDLIGLSNLAAEQYRFHSVELKQTALRLDGLFKPPDDAPSLPLFFVEVQFQADTLLYPRLFAEIFVYLRQYQPPNPWQAVVIYPSRAIDPGDHPHYRALLTSPEVHRVYLDEWAHSPQTLSQRLIHLLLAEPQAAITEAQTLLVQPLDSGPKALILDLIETMLVYKLPALTRKEIQTMLGLTDRDLKQTRFYQEVFAEGEQQGELKGRQEGRHEGEATVILRLLQRRCGVLAPEIKARIAALRLEQLEALAEAVLDFTGLPDLEQWLTDHAKT
jgi:predicted transposase/invertase (TIGR01784 family)